MAKKTITDKNGKKKTITVDDPTPAENQTVQHNLPPAENPMPTEAPTLDKLEGEHLPMGEQPQPTEATQPSVPTLSEGEPVLDPKTPGVAVEGATIVHPNGDIERFENGAWIVHVSHSPRTGEE